MVLTKLELGYDVKSTEFVPTFRRRSTDFHGKRRILLGH
jgi:hypothetical protein